MLILISCAKMFRKTAELQELASEHCSTQACFAEQSRLIAQDLAHSPIEKLQKQLKISLPAASTLQEQMQHFDPSQGDPALLAYHGVAFKNLAAENYSSHDWQRAQEQLRICSFLYGLLRPLDAISPYRLEGRYTLPQSNVFKYWQDILTDQLISDVNAAGGVLCELCSKEMEKLFNWNRLSKAVTIINPQFLIEEKGKRRVCSVRSKQARGAMASAIIQEGWTSLEELKHWGKEEGYRLVEGDEQGLLFVKFL